MPAAVFSASQVLPGMLLSLDCFGSHSPRVRVAVFIYLCACFLVASLRELGPSPIKRGFHAHCSTTTFGLFVLSGWLALLLSAWTSACHQRGHLARRALQVSDAAAEPPPPLPPPPPPPPLAAALPDDDSIAIDGHNLVCSITFERFKDPVIAPDGHTYERRAIEAWVRSKSTSPMTGEAMAAGPLVPNHIVRSIIRGAVSSAV